MNRVEDFKYLREIISNNGKMEQEINARLQVGEDSYKHLVLDRCVLVENKNKTIFSLIIVSPPQ